MNFIKKHNTIFVFLIFVALYLISVFSLLKNGHPINYDDPLLIPPIESLKSFQHYIDLVKNGTIWDIQPVRDLTYFIDYTLIKRTHFWSYYYSNFFIWILIYFGVYKLTIQACIFFNTLNENTKKWCLFFSTIFFVHTIFQLGPFWISSRKHILSCLFIFLASNYLFRFFNEVKNQNLKTVFLIAIFYMLSVFSHPITILFPGFILVVYIIKKIEKKRLFFILLFLVSLIFVLCSALNYYYYFVVFVKQTGVNASVKLIVEDPFQVRFLTFGRFFYQIFDPTMASPFEHDRGSVLNLVGLLTFPIFIYLASKILDYKKVIIACAWFFFPLMLVIANDIKLFALDTYVITASWGIFILLCLGFSRFKFSFLYYFFILPLLYLNFNYANAFLNDLSLAYYAHNKEVSIFNQYALAKTLINYQKFDEGFVESYALSKITPSLSELNYFLPISILYAKKIPYKTKIKLFENLNLKSFYRYYYYSLMFPVGSFNFKKYQHLAILHIHTMFTDKESLIFDYILLSNMLIDSIKLQDDFILKNIDKYRSLTAKWKNVDFLKALFFNQKNFPNYTSHSNDRFKYDLMIVLKSGNEKIGQRMSLWPIQKNY